MTRQLTRTALLAAMLMAITPLATAATPPTIDITESFRAAGAEVRNLQVSEIAGIVIIRGRTIDKAHAEQLSVHAQSLGYNRVANLVQIIEHDDSTIARKAEVELSIHRSLDGCRFSVRSEQGVVTVAGRVRHELQKDVAAQVLRNIDGVQRVELALDKF